MSVHDADYRKIKKLLGIPEDEPIFIIRAKDDLGMAIVTRYRNMAASIEDSKVVPYSSWFESMDNVIDEFGQYRIEHSELVRVPD